jgi:proton glutamate symport protein
MKLHHQIFLAIVLGAIFGSLTSVEGELFGIPILSTYQFLGTMFLNALKMVVIPLIMTAIISGMISVGQGDGLGKIGLKTFGFYMGSGLVAILIGLALVNLITPGLSDGQPVKELGGTRCQYPRCAGQSRGQKYQ